MHQDQISKTTLGCSGTGPQDKEAPPTPPLFPTIPTALVIADQLVGAMKLTNAKRKSILKKDKGVGLQIDNSGVVTEQNIRTAKLGDQGYLIIKQKAALCSPKERPEVKYAAVGFRSFEAAALRFIHRIRNEVKSSEINVSAGVISPINLAQSKLKDAPFALNHSDGTSFSVMVKASISPEKLTEILREGAPSARQRIFDRMSLKALSSTQSEELTLPAVPNKTNAKPGNLAIKPGDTDFQV